MSRLLFGMAILRRRAKADLVENRFIRAFFRHQALAQNARHNSDEERCGKCDPNIEQALRIDASHRCSFCMLDDCGHHLLPSRNDPGEDIGLEHTDDANHRTKDQGVLQVESEDLVLLANHVSCRSSGGDGLASRLLPNRSIFGRDIV